MPRSNSIKVTPASCPKDQMEDGVFYCSVSKIHGTCPYGFDYPHVRELYYKWKAPEQIRQLFLAVKRLFDIA